MLSNFNILYVNYLLCSYIIYIVLFYLNHLISYYQKYLLTLFSLKYTFISQLILISLHNTLFNGYIVDVNLMHILITSSKYKLYFFLYILLYFFLYILLYKSKIKLFNAQTYNFLIFINCFILFLFILFFNNSLLSFLFLLELISIIFLLLLLISPNKIHQIKKTFIIYFWNIAYATLYFYIFIFLYFYIISYTQLRVNLFLSVYMSLYNIIWMHIFIYILMYVFIFFKLSWAVLFLWKLNLFKYIPYLLLIIYNTIYYCTVLCVFYTQFFNVLPIYLYINYLYIILILSIVILYNLLNSMYNFYIFIAVSSILNTYLLLLLLHI